MYTVDTDIVVIFVGKLSSLLERHPAADVWLAFGTAIGFKHIHIDTVCNTLEKGESSSLPIFHSFTGCDIASSFFGKERNQHGKHGNHFLMSLGIFLYMASHPHSPLTTDSNHFKLLERFCIVMYDKTSNLESINEAQRELFCQNNKTMESIPPTQDALLHYRRWVAYQAGIWVTSDIAHVSLPNPADFGWKLTEENKWSPIRITLPVASKACTELVKCGYKSSRGCGGRCVCVCVCKKTQ